MKKSVYFLLAPALFVLASCGKDMPKRKSGQFCSVSFTSEVVTSDCPTFTPIDQNLSFHLDIPYVVTPTSNWDIEPTAEVEGVLTNPNIEYTVTVDDIHVFIGGKEFPDSFTYFQTNYGDNVLTIRKEYVVNDIDIRIDAKKRKFLYLFGLELGEELDKRRVDYDDEDPTPEYPHDLVVKFTRPYQNVKKPIKTLSGQAAYPVFEHDAIEVTFTLINRGEGDPNAQKPLPDDLRYRCNARYTLEGYDYEREYSDLFYSTTEKIYGYRKCKFNVPYKIVNDHGSFRQFGTE